MSAGLMAVAGSCVPEGEAAMPNLISNGSFVDHAGGWFWEVRGHSGNVISYSPGTSRSVDSGSLAIDWTKVTLNTTSLTYRPGGAFVRALGALDEIDVVAWAKFAENPLSLTANAVWTLTFYSGAQGYAEQWVSAVSSADPGPSLVGDTWHEIPFREVAVPEGATHVHLALAFTLPGYAGTPYPLTIDDVYCGESGLDTPPYPSSAANAFPANRVINGDFETDILGWSINWGGETKSWETEAPITGSGSIKVITTIDDFRGGVINGPSVLVTPGETIHLSYKAKGSGTLNARLQYNSTSVTVRTDVLSGSATTYTADHVVPATAYQLYMVFHVSEEVATFWIDDVSLGTPP